jgi:hypothetical protein
MDEKTELVRRINLAPPSDLDSDSEFEEHEEEILTPRTSSNGNTIGEFLPTYEESEAAVRVRTQQILGLANHSEITVYRTEIPPDPPIHQASSDEKQPTSPTSPGPGASRLLNEALRYTETPPPTAERPVLRLPIAVPSLAGTSSPVKFARFDAPALYPQSVAKGEFIEFIDGLNNLAIASNFSVSTYHSRSASSPYEVSRDDEDIRRNDLVAAYVALSNSYYFNPRGLQVQLADLAELADLLKISNSAIRKTILQEVLRMSKTGINVPAATNGAAHQAAEALVPYVDNLTTSVPEPRKNQEALQAVASRFAALHIDDDDARVPDINLERAQTSSSRASMPGPSRAKTWDEFGNDIGKFWSDWGEKQGQYWGRWGEDLGRKVEKWAQGPPSFLAGPSNSGWQQQHEAQRGPQWGRGRRQGPQFGMHAMRGGPGWPAHGGGWGGRSWPIPWTPPGVSLPFQLPSQHSAPMQPQPPMPIPHRMTMPTMAAYTSVPHGMGISPVSPLSPALPTQHGGQESGTTSILTSLHQTPPPEHDSHRIRDTATNHDEEDVEDFADIADTLSLSSVSSTSNSDSDKTLANDDDDPYAEHEAIFASKAEQIEQMAATARANNSKPAHEIELERTRAMMDLEHEYSRNQMRRNHRAQRRELKGDIHAWKKGLRAEFKASKSMDKTERREWKRARKGEWKGFKAQIKQHGKAFKEERRARKRELKEVARAAKREGKKKDWDSKRKEWEEKRREWEERQGSCGRGRGRGRGGNHRRGGRGGFGCTESMESLDDDLEAQAREMLWIVVTKLND